MAGFIQTNELDALRDEELVAAAREGINGALEVLLQRYQRFARTKARGYFLVGADSDDIYQEGMIGLFKAIRDFRDDRQASFRAFAELCITRQIITAIKTATRQKHQPLNSYVSFNVSRSEDDSDRTVEEMIGGDESLDPARAVISLEDVNGLRGSMGAILSQLEQEVLRLYVEGKSYQDIADELNRHAKSIDNAIQRIKRKLEAYLQKRAAEERAFEIACEARTA
ncbi:MAG: RNA polymerase sporulation sigma factor SigH [Acidimicrobiia bacterium]